MFCPNCGNQMKDGAVFCSNCGYKKNNNFGVKNDVVKKYLMLGVIIISIVVVMISIITSNKKSSNSLKVQRGWSGDYYYIDSKIVKNDWVEYDNKWYYLKEDGKYVRNDWKKIGDDYYYFDANGAMEENKWIDNEYYVGADGRMLKNTITPDGYYVGNDGKYVDSNNQNVSSYENATVDSFVTQLKDVINEQPTYIDIANKYVAWELNRDPYNSKDEIIEYWKEYFYGFADIILSPCLNGTPIKINERDYYVLFWFSSSICYPLIISIQEDGGNIITVKLRDVGKNDVISEEQVKESIEDSINSRNHSANNKYYELLDSESLEYILEKAERIKNLQKLILELSDNDFQTIIKSGVYCDWWDRKIEQVGNVHSYQKDYFDEISLQFIYDENSKCWKWIPNSVSEIGSLLGQIQ